jgi:hypothetical protein
MWYAVELDWLVGTEAAVKMFGDRIKLIWGPWGQSSTSDIQVEKEGSQRCCGA